MRIPIKALIKLENKWGYEAVECGIGFIPQDEDEKPDFSRVTTLINCCDDLKEIIKMVVLEEYDDS